MQTLFLDAAGTVLFSRDDMEQGNWTQEEYTVNLTFPYIEGKVIQRGMRVSFRDPATGNPEFFEILNVSTIEPEHYQQLVAEHIAVSELSDEHINTKDYYNVPPQTALAGVLSGTLWHVGMVNVGDLAEQAHIQAEINQLGLNGNVDLTSRPVIYPDKMHNAGYTDFDGDYATLYSMTYTENLSGGSGSAVTLLMTPIQQNGNVLTQDQIDEYTLELCRQSTLEAVKAADSRGLLMHSLSGTQISAMDAIAEQAHDLSDAWEECTQPVASSAKIGRGSVWSAVNTIITNWNVYITPRITTNASGSITGRYLDITSTNGVWRGLRLSLDKNISDASVTVDSSEVVTALYGYGGNIDKAQASGDDKQEELTFAGITWTHTLDHPAKPSGQKYLEWPEKTALYGRNGRPRFGFYQNADITDAEILLEKTWESLKESSTPKINISGTVSDLYRLGYKDQPLRLHDIAIVEIRETGEVFQEQIIKLDVDLIDPTATRPEIGKYIPNIIYISEETGRNASGGGGGGGGGKPKGKTDLQNEQTQFASDWIKNSQQIGMIVGIKNGNQYIKAASIVGSINADGGTNLKLHADTIDMDGVVTALTTILDTLIPDSGQITVTGNFSVGGNAYLSGLSVTNDGYIEIGGATLTLAPYDADWQDYLLRVPTLGTRHYFLYSSASGNLTPSGTARHYPITAYTDITLHFLGRAATS